MSSGHLLKLLLLWNSDNVSSVGNRLLMTCFNGMTLGRCGIFSSSLTFQIFISNSVKNDASWVIYMPNRLFFKFAVKTYHFCLFLKVFSCFKLEFLPRK